MYTQSRNGILGLSVLSGPRSDPFRSDKAKVGRIHPSSIYPSPNSRNGVKGKGARNNFNTSLTVMPRCQAGSSGEETMYILRLLSHRLLLMQSPHSSFRSPIWTNYHKHNAYSFEIYMHSRVHVGGYFSKKNLASGPINPQRTLVKLYQRTESIQQGYFLWESEVDDSRLRYISLTLFCHCHKL